MYESCIQENRVKEVKSNQTPHKQIQIMKASNTETEHKRNLRKAPLFINAKDVERLLDCSPSTAYRNLKAAKADHIRANGKVTLKEFAAHLEIPLEALYYKLDYHKPTG